MSFEMATQRIVLTYRDYEALPADGRRYQILDGELFVTAAPVPLHQRTVGNLYARLRRHVEEQGIGEMFISPIAVILAETTIVEPDLVYLDIDRAPFVTGRGIAGPPTLVIEVLSPSTMAVDRGAKMQLYARYGVPYYWIADAEARCLEAYELAQDAYRLVRRATGATPVSLPPFSDLHFVPDSILPA